MDKATQDESELILAVALQINDLLSLLPFQKRMAPLKIAMETVKLRQAVEARREHARKSLRPRKRLRTAKPTADKG